jgi:hypothetical protein
MEGGCELQTRHVRFTRTSGCRLTTPAKADSGRVQTPPWVRQQAQQRQVQHCVNSKGTVALYHRVRDNYHRGGFECFPAPLMYNVALLQIHRLSRIAPSAFIFPAFTGNNYSFHVA